MFWVPSSIPVSAGFQNLFFWPLASPTRPSQNTKTFAIGGFSIGFCYSNSFWAQIHWNSIGCFPLFPFIVFWSGLPRSRALGMGLGWACWFLGDLAAVVPQAKENGLPQWNAIVPALCQKHVNWNALGRLTKLQQNTHCGNPATLYSEYESPNYQLFCFGFAFGSLMG